VLRAAGLMLLHRQNPHVAADLENLRGGSPLPPVLAVRGSIPRGVPLQVAAGVSRLCAAHHLGMETIVACRIIDLDW
jgi:hypothetical protein